MIQLYSLNVVLSNQKRQRLLLNLFERFEKSHFAFLIRTTLALGKKKGFLKQAAMLFAFVIALICIQLAVSQLTSFYSPSELNARQTAAKKYLLEPASAEDAYFHARILEVTKAKSIDCNCSGLESLVRNKLATPLSVYYGLKASQICGCTVKPLRVIEDAIETDLISEELDKFGGAALASKIMRSSLAPSTESIVAKVKALMQPTGLFRLARTETGSSNMKNTKLALLILAEFNGAAIDLTDVAASVSKLLFDNENEKQSDPTLLAPLYALTGKKPSMEAQGASPNERLHAIGHSLLELRHTTSVSLAASVIESLIILMSYKAQPVYIGLETNQFKFASQAPKTKISVTDAFGKSIPEASVEVTVKKEGRDKSLLEAKASDRVLDLSAQAAEITPGRYSVQLSVTLDGRPKTITTSAYFSVYADLKISEVSAGVSKDKAASHIELAGILEQNGWADELGDASKGHFVHVTFTASTPRKTGPRFHKPHQSFAKFTHIKTGTTSYFTAQSEGSIGGDAAGTGSKYRVSIELKKEAKTLKYLSGLYEVSLLVADSIYSPQEFVVGAVQLSLPAEKVEEPALYVRSLLHTSDHTLHALPEITHKMRPKPKSAPAIMSVLFSGIALIPLGALLYYLISLKLNLKKMKSLHAVAFSAGIGSMCVLYAAYWFTVPGFLFYDTIKYLLFAFPIVGLLGRNAVIATIAAREEEDRTEETSKAKAD